MRRFASVLAITLAACNRVEEPSPSPSPSPGPSLSIETGPDTTPPADTALAAPIADANLNDARADADAHADADADANADADADANANADADASADADANADTAVVDVALPEIPPLAIVPLTLPLAPRLVGRWAFSKFDLSDPGTAARWAKVPAALKKDILLDAPTAIIEVTKDTMVTKLVGIADKKATYTIEGPEGVEPNTLTIKTSDEGRKKIRFLDADTMRVEDLDKKDSFVTVFARKKPGAK